MFSGSKRFLFLSPHFHKAKANEFASRRLKTGFINQPVDFSLLT